MKPIILTDTTRKCPYCFGDFERFYGESDANWARHIYCGKVCAGKGGVVERKQRMAAKRRVICGDL